LPTNVAVILPSALLLRRRDCEPLQRSCRTVTESAAGVADQPSRRGNELAIHLSSDASTVKTEGSVIPSEARDLL